jgi:hypothetical protein
VIVAGHLLIVFSFISYPFPAFTGDASRDRLAGALCRALVEPRMCEIVVDFELIGSVEPVRKSKQFFLR